MSSYQWALFTHVGFVLLSFILFSLRGIWMIRGNNLLQHKIVRILPHLIDTTLLLAGVILTIIIKQYPGIDHWLSVKLVALIIYILLGTIALKRGKTKRQKVVALILSWATFAFIVSVALSHHPAGVFRGIY